MLFGVEKYVVIKLLGRLMARDAAAGERAMRGHPRRRWNIKIIA